MVNVLVILSLVVVVASKESNLKDEIENRIMGGELATEHEFPGIVAIMSIIDLYLQPVCGGSIINKYWGLTAAHCVGVFPGRTIVRVGSNHYQNGGSEHEVLYFIKHEHYDPSNHRSLNDIAVFKVLQPFVFDVSTVQPVKLVASGVNFDDGTEAVTAGWGDENLIPTSSTTLKKINLTTTTGKFCLEDQVCVVAKEPFSGPCHGDSGGPLYVNNELVGITSKGVSTECYVQWYVTAFTSVSYHRGWIESIVDIEE